MRKGAADPMVSIICPFTPLGLKTYQAHKPLEVREEFSSR